MLSAELIFRPVGHHEVEGAGDVGLQVLALHVRGAEHASPEFAPYGIAFDVEKLSWELQFFLKHFVEGYRGAQVAPASREALLQEFATLAEELSAEPRVLCHRDYHSRNLMLHEGRLVVIDFQDARMGPDTYDLVSLLRDSYVDLTSDQVETCVAHFLSLRDQRRALEKADFVIVAFQIGGYEPCTVTDFEVPKRFGPPEEVVCVDVGCSQSSPPGSSPPCWWHRRSAPRRPRQSRAARFGRLSRCGRRQDRSTRMCGRGLRRRELRPIRARIDGRWCVVYMPI